jgi:FkbM family methyltransferase
MKWHEAGWWVPDVLNGIGKYLDRAADMDLALDRCPRSRSVVQAGGHVGIWPKRLAAHFAQVYTFEPDAENFACLARNVPEPHVFMARGVLGRFYGRVGLDFSHKNTGKRMVSGPGAIPTYRIDDLLLDDCDALLLDVEGYELHALAGAEQTIARCLPVILCEENVLCVRQGFAPGQLAAYLGRFGYTQVAAAHEDRIFAPPPSGQPVHTLTVVLPYYENPGMLRKQCEVFAAYAPEVRAHLQLIVVDDGSPTRPAQLPCDPGVPVRIYRCLVDVRWNWLFCRNLGVDQAHTRWVLLTDIDHVIPEETLRAALFGNLNGKRVYRFARVSATEPTLTTRVPYKPHPNSWLLTKKMFDAIGGYDEEASGFYGSDSLFRERVVARAGEPVLLPQVLVRVPREVIPDASTTRYERKTEADRVGIAAARARIAARPPGTGTRRLSFPWTQVH